MVSLAHYYSLGRLGNGDHFTYAPVDGMFFRLCVTWRVAGDRSEARCRSVSPGHGCYQSETNAATRLMKPSRGLIF